MGTVGMVAATGQTANFPDNSEDSSFEDDHYIRNGKIKKAITEAFITSHINLTLSMTL